jgi:hypothetical protein
MNNDMLEGNRRAWNQALAYHRRARNDALQSGFASPDFTTFDRDCDRILWDKLKTFIKTLWAAVKDV